MSKTKILFTIPTLFHNPKLVKECVDSLLHSLENTIYDYDIWVITNTESQEFNDWNPPKGVNKDCSNLEFNIAKALNLAISKKTDHEYFCYIDEGLLCESGWLESVYKIYDKYDNIGMIGNRPHRIFHDYNIKLEENVYEILWSDGIFFFKFDRIEGEDGFDESYFGDCEAQDFCYRLINKGYKNLYLSSDGFGIRHRTVGWEEKSSNPAELLIKAAASRKLCEEKWAQWRRFKCMKTEHKITTCISSFNNLSYLKLAIKSVRQNAYYNDMPIIVHAENCTDGTDEWLEENKERLNLYPIIETNEVPRGIGGGMDICVENAKTEFVNIIHADMWIAPNQDIELLKLYDNIEPNVRLIASSFRIQPKIFPNDPWYRPGTQFVTEDEFGAYHHDFDSKWFDEWSTEFSKTNDVEVRKAGGAGFFCKRADYEWIGGNDPIFAPAYWEDKDLFIRMQLEGYEFKMTTKSLQWHFSSRASRFPDDNLKQRPDRLAKIEQQSTQRFIEKWGRLPKDDADTFVIPIHGTNVKTRIT